MSIPKVALVHEWLINIAGSEVVLAEMLKVFPDADLYSVIDFLSDDEKAKLGKSSISTTFIQKLPFARKLYKYYLALMPMAIERLDVSNYDIVITSSHAVAKGVITNPNQLHICMCYSPMRYIWDMQDEYLAVANLDKGLRSWFIKLFFSRLRKWDIASSKRVDKFIAISQFISERIERIYHCPSTIIYPPVELDNFPLEAEKDDYYLALSRMVPYKRMDLIVNTFASLPDKNLVVIGDGPELPKIRDAASGNIKVLGFQSDNIARQYLSRAKALIFAAKEDFGIVLVEAQACGTPVIAFAEGGANEIIVFPDSTDKTAPAPTGIPFQAQTIESLTQAINRFEKSEDLLTPQNCRKNAERFSSDRFRKEFKNFVEECWNESSLKRNSYK